MKACAYMLRRPLASESWHFPPSPSLEWNSPAVSGGAKIFERALGAREDHQSSRCTIRVRTGSFIAPRRSASRAMSSLTPSISNMIRPGWTRAAQKSIEPLPLPKRILQGKVTSDKNEQTITVLVERRFKHPLLHKTVRSSKKYRAHDALNQFKVGDTVRIVECAPISKTKRWTVFVDEAQAVQA